MPAGNLGEAVLRISANLQGLSAGLAQATTKVKAWSATAQSMGTKFGAGIRRGSEALKGFSQSLKSVSGSLNGIAGQATMVSIAIGGMFLPAVIAGAKFEQGMANVKAVVGELREPTEEARQKFADLEAQAAKLGETTKFSASQVSEAMQFLGLAGFTADEIMQGVGKTLELATAGAMDLGRAADIASDTMSAFGLAASDIGRIGDVLANTASKSNTSVEMLGSALSFVAPVAGQMGVSIEETAAAIGKLSDAGIKGSRAGTGLLQVLSILAKGGKNVSGVISKYGLTLDDVNPTVVGLTGAIEALAGANITAADMMTMFGQRAGPAAQVLSGVTDGMRELTESNNDAKGAAADMAAVMKDTLKGAWTELMSAVEGLNIAIFKAIQGSLAEFVQKAKEVVGRISEWVKANSGLVATIAKMLLSIGGIAVVVAGASGALAMIVSVISTLAGAASAVAGVVSAKFIAIGAAIAAVASVTVIPMIAAIIANWDKLKAAALALWENVLKPTWEGFRDLVVSAWETVFKPLFGLLVEAVGQLFDAFKRLFESLKPLAPLFKTLGAVIAGIVLAPIIVAFTAFVTVLKITAGAVSFLTDMWIKFMRIFGRGKHLETSEERAARLRREFDANTESIKRMTAATRELTEAEKGHVSNEQKIIQLLEKRDKATANDLDQLAKLLDAENNMQEALQRDVDKMRAQEAAARRSLEVAERQGRATKELRDHYNDLAAELANSEKRLDDYNSAVANQSALRDRIAKLKAEESALRDVVEAGDAVGSSASVQQSKYADLQSQIGKAQDALEQHTKAMRDSSDVSALTERIAALREEEESWRRTVEAAEANGSATEDSRKRWKDLQSQIAAAQSELDQHNAAVRDQSALQDRVTTLKSQASALRDANAASSEHAAVTQEQRDRYAELRKEIDDATIALSLRESQLKSSEGTEKLRERVAAIEAEEAAMLKTIAAAELAGTVTDRQIKDLDNVQDRLSVARSELESHNDELRDVSALRDRISAMKSERSAIGEVIEATKEWGNSAAAVTNDQKVQYGDVQHRLEAARGELERYQAALKDADDVSALHERVDTLQKEKDALGEVIAQAERSGRVTSEQRQQYADLRTKLIAARDELKNHDAAVRDTSAAEKRVAALQSEEAALRSVIEVSERGGTVAEQQRVKYEAVQEQLSKSRAELELHEATVRDTSALAKRLAMLQSQETAMRRVIAAAEDDGTVTDEQRSKYADLQSQVADARDELSRYQEVVEAGGDTSALKNRVEALQAEESAMRRVVEIAEKGGSVAEQQRAQYAAVEAQLKGARGELEQLHAKSGDASVLQRRVKALVAEKIAMFDVIEAAERGVGVSEEQQRKYDQISAKLSTAQRALHQHNAAMADTSALQKRIATLQSERDAIGEVIAKIEKGSVATDAGREKYSQLQSQIAKTRGELEKHNQLIAKAGDTSALQKRVTALQSETDAMKKAIATSERRGRVTDRQRSRYAKLQSQLASARGELEKHEKLVGNQSALKKRIAALQSQADALRTVTIAGGENAKATDEQKKRYAALQKELAAAQAELDSQTKASASFNKKVLEDRVAGLEKQEAAMGRAIKSARENGTVTKEQQLEYDKLKSLLADAKSNLDRYNKSVKEHGEFSVQSAHQAREMAASIREREVALKRLSAARGELGETLKELEELEKQLNTQTMTGLEGELQAVTATHAEHRALLTARAETLRGAISDARKVGQDTSQLEADLRRTQNLIRVNNKREADKRNEILNAQREKERAFARDSDIEAAKRRGDNVQAAKLEAEKLIAVESKKIDELFALDKKRADLEKARVRERANDMIREAMDEENKQKNNVIHAAERERDIEEQVTTQLVQQVRSVRDLFILYNALFAVRNAHEKRALDGARRVVKEREKLERLEKRLANAPDAVGLQRQVEAQKAMLQVMEAMAQKRHGEAGLVGLAGNQMKQDKENLVADLRVLDGEIAALQANFRRVLGDEMPAAISESVTAWVEAAVATWQAQAHRIVTAVRATMSQVNMEMHPATEHSPSLNQIWDMNVSAVREGMNRIAAAVQSNAPNLHKMNMSSVIPGAAIPNAKLAATQRPMPSVKEMHDNRVVRMDINNNVDMADVARQIGRSLSSVGMDAGEI